MGGDTDARSACLSAVEVDPPEFDAGTELVDPAEFDAGTRTELLRRIEALMSENEALVGENMALMALAAPPEHAAKQLSLIHISEPTRPY